MAYSVSLRKVGVTTAPINPATPPSATADHASSLQSFERCFDECIFRPPNFWASELPGPTIAEPIQGLAVFGASWSSVRAAAGWSSGAMVARYTCALSGELAVEEFQRSWADGGG